MQATRRQFLAEVTAATLAAPAAAGSGGAVTPEMFGAKGDGRTNDTAAFANMSAHMNERGGGMIVLRRTTYIVGRQRSALPPTHLSLTPWDVIHLKHCTGPVTIAGNGAKLLCAAGLRYGRFDPVSGLALPDSVKFDLTGDATPYSGMIHIEQCSGSITISDLELDGNAQQLIVGGRTSGPAGWLAGSTGIRLIGNTGSERLSRIHSHHHAQDGLILTAAHNRTGSTVVSDVVCEYNGRQGCSITGGQNYRLERCHFRHTGRTPFWSSPGAGVDIEAESSPIRDVHFLDCEFADNRGFGLVSGSGDSADIVSDNCRFVGTTNWAVWPDSPSMRFNNCLIVGSINHTYGSADPALATQFADCVFTDDATLSPTRKVYLPAGNWIVVARPAPNVQFRRCHFRLVGEGLLPLSSAEVIYADCDMSQRSAKLSAPIGTYIGANAIRGNATLEGSNLRGTVNVNGRVLSRAD